MSRSLGEVMSDLRSRAGIESQRELARLLNVDPSYIARLEKGEREPSISLLRKFAEETSIAFPVLLAKALINDMEESEKKAYEGIIDKLVEIAETRA